MLSKFNITGCNPQPFGIVTFGSWASTAGNQYTTFTNVIIGRGGFVDADVTTTLKTDCYHAALGATNYCLSAILPKITLNSSAVTTASCGTNPALYHHILEHNR
jgi:hypothetical protein